MFGRKKKDISERLYNLFYTPSTPGFYIINDILAITTVASVLSIILETVPSFSEYSALFFIIEYISVILFTLEYVGRVIANKKHISSYTLSFFGIIDLLAILPSFFGLSNFAFLKTARVLRILRLLRMARLAKLAKKPKRKEKQDDESANAYKLSIQIYFATVLSAVVLSGTLVYVFEGKADGTGMFASIPHGMLWALKVTLGMTPGTMPVTMIGEAITIMTFFFGLLLFGLLISVMGTSLQRLLLGD